MPISKCPPIERIILRKSYGIKKIMELISIDHTHILHIHV